MARSYGERFGGAALITGASAGLGATFARALAARGMDLCLVARREERLRASAAELSREFGVRAVPVAVDLAAPGGTEALVRAVGEAGVDVGLLVANAGFGTYGPFAEQDPPTESRMVDLNCRAVVEQCHAFVPGMRARGRGGIIVVASTAAFQPTPYFAVYGATKAFDLAFAEALGAELAPSGIDVLALCPGFVATEFQQVAGAPIAGPTLTPERVVDTALRSLGRRSSVVPGAYNALTVFGNRLVPRSWAARVVGWMMDPRRLAGR